MDWLLTWIGEIGVEFWGVLSEMAPYLLFGFFVAGLLSVVIAPARVERHLGAGGPMNVFKAALLGVPLPLCSCGVIPVTASLRRHGASRGSAVSFLISTPQTGVDSIFVTYSLLGGVYAIFRPLAALLSGFLGGLLVTFTGEKDAEKEPNAEPEECTDACCESEKHGKLYRIFSYGFGTLPRDIAGALLVGVIAAALITALLPAEKVAGWLGGGILGILVMMVLGIPVYVCATASVPIAAALILKGVITPGAGFAFLMTGPATNAATVATVWRVMGKRTAVLYVGTMAAAAVVGGLALDYVFRVSGASPHRPQMWMLPQWFNHIAAFVLLALLLWSIAQRWVRRGHAEHEHEHEAEGAKRYTFRVDGMTCSHCADTVQRALMTLRGAKQAWVDLDADRATVLGDVDPVAAQQEIEKLGYQVERDEVG